MSELRVPTPPLPRPFARVVSEPPITRDDVERVRRTLQQSIDELELELKRERELNRKFEKSGAVLQEILEAPNFRALSMAAPQTSGGATAAAATVGGNVAYVDEGPVEYVDVTEVELNDTEVQKQEVTVKPAGPA